MSKQNQRVLALNEGVKQMQASVDKYQKQRQSSLGGRENWKKKQQNEPTPCPPEMTTGKIHSVVVVFFVFFFTGPATALAFFEVTSASLGASMSIRSPTKVGKRGTLSLVISWKRYWMMEPI